MMIDNKKAQFQLNDCIKLLFYAIERLEEVGKLYATTNMFTLTEDLSIGTVSKNSIEHIKEQLDKILENIWKESVSVLTL